MSEPRYKIVFDGTLMPGAEMERTKDNLASLFKSERQKIDALFNGSSVALKRDLGREEAEKYQSVLQAAGAQVRIETEFASTLSLVETEEHDGKPSDERMQCPKCGHEQAKGVHCEACGIVIEKYLARQAQLADAQPTAAAASPYATPQAAVGEQYAAFGELNPFGVQGRIGRMRYLAWSFVFGLAMLPLYGIAIASMIGISEILGGILIAAIVIIAIVFAVFIGVQRLHDIGWSGWLWLLNLIPLVNTVFSIMMLVMPGTQGSNAYGPPPPPNSTSVLVLAWLLIGTMILSVLAAIAVPVIAAVALAA